MPYTVRATSRRPALIVYLIDASETMRQPCGAGTRMDVVHIALQAMLRELTQRSMTDMFVQDRYHLAIFAYSTEVLDVLAASPDADMHDKSIWTLSELLKVGLPRIEPGGETDTYTAFMAAEALIARNLDLYKQSPAPLICHFTDGGFSVGTAEPAPVIKRIMRTLKVEDGPVLIENVFIADNTLTNPPSDLRVWPGVTKKSDLSSEYARYLFDLSSPLPASHRNFINSRGYKLDEHAAMFFPGSEVDLVRLAFVASAATY